MIKQCHLETMLNAVILTILFYCLPFFWFFNALETPSPQLLETQRIQQTIYKEDDEL
jgi:hypothetical protein